MQKWACVSSPLCSVLSHWLGAGPQEVMSPLSPLLLRVSRGLGPSPSQVSPALWPKGSSALALSSFSFTAIFPIDLLYI